MIWMTHGSRRTTPSRLESRLCPHHNCRVILGKPHVWLPPLRPSNIYRIKQCNWKLAGLSLSHAPLSFSFPNRPVVLHSTILNVSSFIHLSFPLYQDETHAQSDVTCSAKTSLISIEDKTAFHREDHCLLRFNL